ncbi:hypothetical protein [Uliginosibacterium sp. 31-12]|uniref:hypothetical protein n=1 Tax=Uliginosibacterium sp. 31-12 TaxID=3062781 RepID=UPI0026E1D23C|nr:hypothetical protein [Uliginosibacterium sp. 31-12]MDO6385576.1 hypothetical protein [Uliginosibacterium sp. 31-12]
MSKLSAIPAPGGDLQSIQRSAKVLSQNFEYMTGARGNKIKTLPENASVADIIAKLNEVINRLQGD